MNCLWAFVFKYLPFESGVSLVAYYFNCLFCPLFLFAFDIFDGVMGVQPGGHREKAVMHNNVAFTREGILTFWC